MLSTSDTHRHTYIFKNVWVGHVRKKKLLGSIDKGSPFNSINKYPNFICMSC